MGYVIVAAIDFSEITPLVLEKTAEQARLQQGAEVHLLHVLPLPGPATALGAPNLAQEMTEIMAKAKEQLEKVGRTIATNLTVFGHVRVGSPQDEVVNLAIDKEADLVIVGASEKGLVERAILGSTAYYVLRKGPCPVLIVRPKLQQPHIEPPRPGQDPDLHKRHHPRAHTYSEAPPSFGRGSMTFRFDQD
jgi:nucleotide-binding universal stress UspA family protein